MTRTRPRGDPHDGQRRGRKDHHRDEDRRRHLPGSGTRSISRPRTRRPISTSRSARRVPNLSVSRIDPATETARLHGGSHGDRRARISTSRARRSSRRTSARRAPRRSRSSGRSLAPLTGARTGSSCSTRPRPGTRCCCSMRPRPITAMCSRNLSDMPESVRELLPRLRDPEFSRVLIVTLPEATPGPRGGLAPARPHACRDHALRLGHQPEPGSARPHGPDAPVAAVPRAALHPGGQRGAAPRTALVPWQADIASQARTTVLEHESRPLARRSVKEA